MLTTPPHVSLPTTAHQSPANTGDAAGAAAGAAADVALGVAGDVAVGGVTTLAVAGGLKASGIWDKMLGGGAIAVAGEALFVLLTILMAAKSAQTQKSETRPGDPQEDTPEK